MPSRAVSGLFGGLSHGFQQALTSYLDQQQQGQTAGQVTADNTQIAQPPDFSSPQTPGTLPDSVGDTPSPDPANPLAIMPGTSMVMRLMQMFNPNGQPPTGAAG